MPSHRDNPPLRRTRRIVCLLLIVATIAVYWQTLNHDFVDFDDDDYVTQNPHVQAGLTVEGVVWAFTANHASNWHPLAWLSHMLDCQVFGLDPSGHHFTNLLLHLANTLLLLLVLERMTGAFWRSVFVAALFGLHPLHVESVAWVSERKDVLSTLFWLLTTWFYVRYVKSRSVGTYITFIVLFALGLMAKPMLVTLPFVLLLLDYWPLGRFHTQQSGDDVNTYGSMDTVRPNRKRLAVNLIWEKTPLFALSAISSVITFIVQEAAESLGDYSIKIRIGNALVSYVKYIGKMFWPSDLAIFYPHPGSAVTAWESIGAGLLMVCISILIIRAARRCPYLSVGWMWYVGTLVPVIGVVQVGSQAMADRYTYVPLIGLFVAISWGVSDLVGRWRYRKYVFPVFMLVLVSSLIVCSRHQARYWRNTTTLFGHAIDVTTNNHLAHYNLANVLEGQGRLEEAIAHYSEALDIRPNLIAAHTNLAGIFWEQGRLEEAIAQYSETLRLGPASAEAHTNLAGLFWEQGRLEEAIAHYSEALKIQPEFVEVHNNLGTALAMLNRLNEAITHFSMAIKLRPDYTDAHKNLGQAYWLLGNEDLALREYETVKRLDVELANQLRDWMHISPLSP